MYVGLVLFLLYSVFSETLLDYSRRRYFDHVKEVNEKIIQGHRKEFDDHPPFSKPVFHPFRNGDDLRRSLLNDPFGYDPSILEDMKPLHELYNQKKTNFYERRSLLEDSFEYNRNIELVEDISKARSSLDINAQIHKGSFNLDVLMRRYRDEFDVLECSPLELKLKILKGTDSYDIFSEYFIPGTRFSSEKCGERVTYSLVQGRKISTTSMYDIVITFKTQPLSLKEFFLDLKLTFENDNGQYKDVVTKEEVKESKQKSGQGDIITVSEMDDDSEQTNDEGDVSERRFLDKVKDWLEKTFKLSGVWDKTIPILQFDYNYDDDSEGAAGEFPIFAKEFHTKENHPIANCFNCFVHFDSGIYIRLEYSFIDVDRFNVELYGEFKAALGILFNFTGTYEFELVVYDERKLIKAIKFSIWGFPIFIDIYLDQISIKMELETLFELGVMEQMELEAEARMGYLYDEDKDDEHNVYKDFSYFYEIASPQIIIGGGTVILKTSIIPKFIIMIEKVCPIIFAPIPWFEFDLELFPAPNRSAELRFFWGIDLQVGVDELEFFDMKFDLGGALPWTYTFAVWPRTEWTPCPWCDAVGSAVGNMLEWVDEYNMLDLKMGSRYLMQDGVLLIRSGETKNIRLRAMNATLIYLFLHYNMENRQDYKFHVNVRQPMDDAGCPYRIKVDDDDRRIFSENVGSDMSSRNKLFSFSKSQFTDDKTYVEFLTSASTSHLCSVKLNVYVTFDSSGEGINSTISFNEMLFYDLVDLSEQYIRFTYSDNRYALIFFGEGDDENNYTMTDSANFKFADRTNFRFLTSSNSLGLNTEKFVGSNRVGLFSPYGQTFQLTIQKLYACNIHLDFEYTEEEMSKNKELNILDIQFHGINISLFIPFDQCLGQDFNGMVFQDLEILEKYLNHFKGGLIWKQMLTLFMEQITPYMEAEDFENIGRYVQFHPYQVVFMFPPVGQSLYYPASETYSETISLSSPLPSEMFLSGDDRNGVEGSSEMEIKSDYCMNECTGRGICMLRRCMCFPGYTGKQCEHGIGVGDAAPTIVILCVLCCWGCCFACCICCIQCFVTCYCGFCALKRIIFPSPKKKKKEIILTQMFDLQDKELLLKNAHSNNEFVDNFEDMEDSFFENMGEDVDEEEFYAFSKEELDEEKKRLLNEYLEMKKNYNPHQDQFLSVLPKRRKTWDEIMNELREAKKIQNELNEEQGSSRNDSHQQYHNNQKTKKGKQQSVEEEFYAFSKEELDEEKKRLLNEYLEMKRRNPQHEQFPTTFPKRRKTWDEIMNELSEAKKKKLKRKVVRTTND